METPLAQEKNPHLFVDSGPHAGLEYAISEATTTIGRDSSNLCCLHDDTTVSGRHASIRLAPDAAIIANMGAKNGIVIERAGAFIRVHEELPLMEGDRIRLGSSALLFSFEAPASKRPGAAAPRSIRPKELLVSLHGDTLKFRLSGAWPLSPQYETAYPHSVVDDIQSRLRILTESAGIVGESTGVSLEPELRSLGEMIRRFVLPPRIEEHLQALEAEPLTLIHDSELLGIPWELTRSGQHGQWCTRFDFARQIVLEDYSVHQMHERRGGAKRLVILSAPTEDLFEWRSCAEDVLRLVRSSYPNVDVEYFAGQRITAGAVLKALDGADGVYYFGHGSYDSSNAAATGWLLHDGVMPVAQLSRLDQPPRFVFSNACESAREGGTAKKRFAWAEQTGMAAAFLRAGVEHYLGAAGPVSPDAAAVLAYAFFESLLAARPVGTALREARTSLRDGLTDPRASWAGYILFGDPCTRYFSVPGCEM